MQIFAVACNYIYALTGIAIMSGLRLHRFRADQFFAFAWWQWPKIVVVKREKMVWVINQHSTGISQNKG